MSFTNVFATQTGPISSALIDQNFADLPSTAAGKGSHLVGHTYDANHLIGTIGGIVNATMPSLWWKFTDAEIADIRAGTRTIDLTAKINAALDQAKCWYVPDGAYRTDTPLLFNDSNFLHAPGRAAIFYPTHNGAWMAGKAVTVAAGTDVRRFDGGANGIFIYGPGTASANSIALDLRGCNRFKFANLRLQNFQTLVRQGNGYATFYNGFLELDAATFGTGYLNDALGNETKVFGGRYVDFVTGTSDSDNSGSLYEGAAWETFTGAAHKTTGAATQYIEYASSRIETSSAGAKGFDIASTSQWTKIRGGKPVVVAAIITEISPGIPTGFKTDVDLPEYRSISGGRAIKFQTMNPVVKSLASLAAGAFRHEPFTIPDYLPGDIVKPHYPANWPGGVQFSAAMLNGGTALCYGFIKNETGATVNFPANQEFLFEITRYVR